MLPARPRASCDASFRPGRRSIRDAHRRQPPSPGVPFLRPSRPSSVSIIDSSSYASATSRTIRSSTRHAPAVSSGVRTGTTTRTRSSSPAGLTPSPHERTGRPMSGRRLWRRVGLDQRRQRCEPSSAHLRRWRTALAQEDTAPPRAPDLAAACAVLGHPPAMATFFTAAVAHLPGLLRDDVALQSLLFPDGRSAPHWAPTRTTSSTPTSTPR